MLRLLLLAVAFEGLGDNDFKTRQFWERYLAASGYDAVLLHRAAPYLGASLQAKVTLRRLEKRYYAAWDNRLARNDWREHQGRVLLSPWCRPYPDAEDFCCWDVGGSWDPLRPLLRHYDRKAWAERELEARSSGLLGKRRVRGMPSRVGATSNGATLELLRDLRSWGPPAWAAEALLGYLRWRNASLERRYGVTDPPYSRR